MYRSHKHHLTGVRISKSRNHNKEKNQCGRCGGTGLGFRADWFDVVDQYYGYYGPEKEENNCVGRWQEKHIGQVKDDGRRPLNPQDRVIHDRTRWVSSKSTDTSRTKARDTKEEQTTLPCGRI